MANLHLPHLRDSTGTHSFFSCLSKSKSFRHPSYASPRASNYSPKDSAYHLIIMVNGIVGRFDSRRKTLDIDKGKASIKSPPDFSLFSQMPLSFLLFTQMQAKCMKHIHEKSLHTVPSPSAASWDAFI